LFGHHQLIFKAFLQWNVCKNRVQHLTYGGQYYADQRLNCRNQSEE
jgi:hypothetical protein